MTAVLSTVDVWEERVDTEPGDGALVEVTIHHPETVEVIRPDGLTEVQAARPPSVFSYLRKDHVAGQVDGTWWLLGDDGLPVTALSWVEVLRLDEPWCDRPNLSVAQIHECEVAA